MIPEFAIHAPRTFLLRGFLAAAAAVLVVASAVPASADSSADVPIEYKNSNCGSSIPKLREIGRVYFERVGDQLSIDVEVRKGPHNASFDVYLYDGDTCNELSLVGQMQTDRRGNGFFVTEVDATGYSSFFATLYGGGNKYFGYSDSLVANVP